MPSYKLILACCIIKDKKGMEFFEGAINFMILDLGRL